jgi:hypothetical protein
VLRQARRVRAGPVVSVRTRHALAVFYRHAAADFDAGTEQDELDILRARVDRLERELRELRAARAQHPRQPGRRLTTLLAGGVPVEAPRHPARRWDSKARVQGPHTNRKRTHFDRSPDG